MQRVGLLVLAFGAIVVAQSGGRPAFEVATIKRPPRTSAGAINAGVTTRIDNAQAELRNMTLALIIGMAYRLPPNQVKAPGWLQNDHWDIVGKLPRGSSSKQVPEMLQRLLAERFKMATHFEEEERPAYELVLGKGPLRVTPNRGSNPDQHGCRGNPHHICQRMSMAELATLLTTTSLLNSMGGPGMTPWALDRPVFDRTGLAGSYDFVMDYGHVMPSDDHASPIDISIADAVKDLGLALKPTTQKFQVLVVDEIQRDPTEN
jgi:uncharacterized protein (TIGR03435 family)